jgi:autotransporter translocation and assembly factor TamB
VSRLGLSELNAFTGNEMVRGGVINGYGTISFKDKRPVVNGKISLEKGKLAIDGVEPQVGPVDADFVLNSDTVLISRCKGKWGSGSLDAIGFLVWSPDSIKDVAISGKLKNTTIELPDMATSRIQDFRFSFSRRKSDFLLSGTADLGATRLIRDIRLVDFIDQINNTNELEKEKNSFLKNVSLQIKVNCIENPLVDINLGYMEMAADLSITGNALSPTFVGELSVIDGYVLYLDRQFTISKGEISNYDQYTFNPSIAIKAKTDVFYNTADSSVVTDTMILDIYGNLKKIEFKLSSYSGNLTEADIISILTFGQKLGAVGGDIKQRIRAFAGQSLLGLGTRKLEQYLDIDRIDFSGDIFDMKSQNSPTVKVTKRISPKLIVSYETAIANLSRRKISAFYRLTKYFYLRGNTESKGESGIDLIFKISK